MKNEALKIKDGLFYDERSAGGIVFKEDNGKIFWLLVKTISSYKTKKEHKGPVYKFPKGHLKEGEFLKQAALREVEEEGRVKANVLAKIGSNNYILWDQENKKKIIKKVTFFLMEYTGQSSLKYYDSEMVIERGWFNLEEAGEKLAYDSEKVLLRKAKIKLESLVGK
ncbi:MAG: NUDIX domain-containing protein [Candidatus Shapirobacteria bacterium]|nr:NUDIX domain-containing protein [Candidatus Shapirobacteria bacterium]